MKLLINIIEKIIRIHRKLLGTQQLLDIQNRMLQIEYAKYREQLLADDRFQKSDRLPKYGYAIYSQFDEDGIIQEIFRRIGATNKSFVEIGVGDGLENNTLFLLTQGWSGVWLEGNPKSIKTIKRNLSDFINNKKLSIHELFVTKDNVDQFIKKGIESVSKSQGEKSELDLLSIDIDGNDLEILKNIKSINPRVIIMEYNGKIPPPIHFKVKYNPSHTWNGDFYIGASLKTFEEEIGQMGYALVGCNLNGNNAFFVRKDLITNDLFPGPFTAEYHFEPPRYHMIGQNVGHETTFNTLKGYEK